MGEKTGISWTDSTCNVWHGCEKVSPGCKHCYAEVSTPVRVKRARGLEVWGRDAARDETKSWEKNLREWSRDVVRSASGEPRRVFGQSLSDTFEDRRDLDPLRDRFFALIDAWESRSLVFQLLTKRPENIRRMVPPSWLTTWPSHVWIGTTVEDQERADERIPHLLRVPAAVRFLSVEPQIGPVDLDAWIGDGACLNDAGWGPAPPWIHWVIQGGESGSKARPFHVDWMYAMKAQCAAAGVAWFPKQMGANVVDARRDGVGTYRLSLRDSHGGDESEWPLDLQGCRAFPVQP